METYAGWRCVCALPSSPAKYKSHSSTGAHITVSDKYDSRSGLNKLLPFSNT
jgi:hypothetical protein